MPDEPVTGALPADDPVAAQMTALRALLVGGTAGACYKAGRTLWGALDAALSVHRPGLRVLFASACGTHHPGGPDPGCPNCMPEVRTRVCAECRDGFGDPLPFAECRVRLAVLAKLAKGEG